MIKNYPSHALMNRSYRAVIVPTADVVTANLRNLHAGILIVSVATGAVIDVVIVPPVISNQFVATVGSPLHHWSFNAGGVVDHVIGVDMSWAFVHPSV